MVSYGTISMNDSADEVVWRSNNNNINESLRDAHISNKQTKIQEIPIFKVLAIGHDLVVINKTDLHSYDQSRYVRSPEIWHVGSKRLVDNDDPEIRVGLSFMKDVDDFPPFIIMKVEMSYFAKRNLSLIGNGVEWYNLIQTKCVQDTYFEISSRNTKFLHINISISLGIRYDLFFSTFNFSMSEQNLIMPHPVPDMTRILKKPPKNRNNIPIPNYDNHLLKEYKSKKFIIRLENDNRTKIAVLPLVEINIKVSNFSITENNDSTFFEIRTIGWQIHCPHRDDNSSKKNLFLIVDDSWNMSENMSAMKLDT
ncbi:hypothetical protein RF11_11111 [Thelohanellus kitauei]|uniref:Uncharacterized protein n=1 Tax=Thelohanellus kitauei TaxID=669202 RepID=A0A0C2MZ95_THEKT|nr:hypothetical protein RF11_11111 [Thelohanellus kitauei]